jgi:hypothetical protein
VKGSVKGGVKGGKTGEAKGGKEAGKPSVPQDTPKLLIRPVPKSVLDASIVQKYSDKAVKAADLTMAHCHADPCVVLDPLNPMNNVR